MCARACSFTYPACKEHAPYYTVICGLFGIIIFFHITTFSIFSGKKVLNLKCMPSFSLQISYETCPILRILRRNIATNVHTSSCRISVILVGF